MSHGIGLKDKLYGSVSSVWHRMKQFICVGEENFVTMEQAHDTNVKINKVPTFVEGLDAEGDGLTYTKSGSYALVRDDDGTVLCPSVGERYTVVQRQDILNNIDEFLLASFPQLKICSVGTLFDGAMFILQLKAAEYFIKGDQSPQECQLSLSDHAGVSALRIGATNCRIVCKNTHDMAMASAKALVKIRHTRSAHQRVQDQMDLFAEFHMELKREVDKLESLVDKPLTADYTERFLNKHFPLVYDDKGNQVTDTRSATIATNKRNKFLSVFETRDDALDQGVQFTRYGLFQAYTDYQDHHNLKSRDIGATTWDAINGDRAAKKSAVLADLLKS